MKKTENFCFFNCGHVLHEKCVLKIFNKNYFQNFCKVCWKNANNNCNNLINNNNNNNNNNKNNPNKNSKENEKYKKNKIFKIIEKFDNRKIELYKNLYKI